MAFSISEEEQNIVTVTMKMEFDPMSPLAVAALPILFVDNDLALKVLLPLALSARR
jgi:hypothetical protein